MGERGLGDSQEDVFRKRIPGTSHSRKGEHLTISPARRSGKHPFKDGEMKIQRK